MSQLVPPAPSKLKHPVCINTEVLVPSSGEHIKHDIITFPDTPQLANSLQL